MKSVFVILALLGFAIPTYAQDPSEKRDEVVEKREQRQQKRIQEGVKSGELNGQEAQKLEGQQAHIKKLEDKALADGKIDKKEFRRIERAQNRANKNIARKKHNEVKK